MIPPLPTFRQVLAAAIADISEHGYVSPERIADWVTRLRNAAEREMGSQTEVDRETTRKLVATFERLVDRDGILKFVPEVSRYTRAMIRPELRAELDRRILAAVDLIKLDRKRAVEATLDRFSGLATSIPPGGDATLDRVEARVSIGKSVARERYQRRLVANDQGHKLVANIAEITALNSGAIAGIWNDHGVYDHSYNARKEHMRRSGKIFVVRGGWAYEQGLIKSVHGYTDEITKPAVEINCRCWYQWIASPRRLPDAYLTRKGQEWLAQGKQAA